MNHVVYTQKSFPIPKIVYYIYLCEIEQVWLKQVVEEDGCWLRTKEFLKREKTNVESKI